MSYHGLRSTDTYSFAISRADSVNFLPKRRPENHRGSIQAQEDGFWFSQRTDDAGRRTLIKNALNQETRFTYDANGNLTTMKDALLRLTRFEYDDNNRRVKTMYHDESFETIEYDQLGRAVLKQDQAGQQATFKA